MLQKKMQLFGSKYFMSTILIFRIRRFPGETKYLLGAEVELSATVQAKKSWVRPPISMEFQVPMFTASGLHVRFLKVLEQRMHYQAIKW